ncbi:cellulose biosynthesis cyclic di-GMP-binding regulatory protein BcsB [Mariprofundus erugo]|uniref:Cyclic di-GMP-binding protein n=1 Tax=Mariprofundus erugo TaxID=2528639 RepID=A0A5R9GWF0_9PROT|nr:cellulose biosynthesis cyclic di-GMP-binding regulatory protein BcsB [Mariprofundus erugo]TLS69205.1 cellulose biosynthesis cyclic di-GMP-binding regulatory protein BcsB [Mariprofundus erugo]
MRSYLDGSRAALRVLLCVSLFLFVQPAFADIGDRLEVTEGTTSLYAGPSSAASRLMAINAGEQMVEMERQGAWVFVSLKRSGDQGWILASQVRKATQSNVRAASAVAEAPRINLPVAQPAAKKELKKESAKKASRQARVVEPEVLPVAMEQASSVKILPPPVNAQPEGAFATHKVSLEDLGFRKGIMFEGATVSHAATFFFPAPLDSRITNGTLRLMFRASPDLHEFANIRISINDTPQKQVLLPGDGGMHEVDVLLGPSAFHGKLVKVTVSAVLPMSDDRCFDDRLSNIFLHIMPESSMAISYQPLAESIRDAWRLLPHKVTISLSEGVLSNEQFASTLAVMSILADEGKKVEIVRLPVMGDIVVAPKAALEGMMANGSLRDDKGEPIGPAGKPLDQVSNLALATFANRTSVVVTDPFDVQPMYLLDDNWKMLGAGDHYRVYRPDNLRAHGGLLGTEGEAGFYSLPLTTLGMNVDARYITREVSWQTVISPYALPLGTEPDFLNLEIVAPVRWKDDPDYELYVFLNDILVKSARLADNGMKQHFTVGLPSEYQKQFNEIRVVIQHDIETGDCHGVMPHDYVQITPDSNLVVKKESTLAPAKFSDLSRYFQTGFDTYLDKNYLSHPDKALHLLARLAADFPLVIDHNRLHFVDSTERLSPEVPFVAVGSLGMADDVEAPVRFDRGHVRIQSPKGESYFDVSELSKVTVAEIVKAPFAYGLWVTPSDNADEEVRDRLELTTDNVAFIDSLGVIKTLDSSEPSLAQVYYPDAEDWFDVLGKYRFWLMALLWFLLTMVIVYIYRVAQTNKRARMEDETFYREEEVRVHGDAAAHMVSIDDIAPTDSLDHLDQKR